MAGLDPDVRRAASHRHMIDHLTDPFGAGAVDTPVAASAVGLVPVTRAAREPLLLAAPAAPLAERGLRLRATLDPHGAATALAVLDFAPYTEAGAFLPLYRPPVDSSTRLAQPFAVGLALADVGPDGSETPLLPADIAGRLDVRLLEGVMGRMIYLLGAEKARLRRQGRELAAMRRLSTARDAALDQRGAELGVPRFPDHLVFLPDGPGGPGGPGGRLVDDPAFQGSIVTLDRREPDEEYRRRLALYQPFAMPTRRQALALLNGPGDPADPNRGPLADLGFPARFQVVEVTNPFAVAIHIVAAGDPAVRASFFDFIRQVYLVEPGVDVPAARYLPSGHRARENALRARLRLAFAFPAGAAGAAVAPALAAALDRVGRCVRALAAGGSRYELGLGLDVPPLPADVLDALAAQAGNPARPRAVDEQGREDGEVEGLLQSMTPRPAAEDPEGTWLLAPCGLRTVHRVNTNRLYLSHFPTFGLVISGADVTAAGTALPLEGRYQAPGDRGQNVVLQGGLTAALAGWVAGGGAPWTELADAPARQAWDQAQARPATDPALLAFAAAGLPALTAPAGVVDRLKRVPDELLATIRLERALGRRILAGTPAAVQELRRLLGALREQHLSSVLPLIGAGNTVLLVVAVIGLPEAGINLSDQRATGFRWYAAPIQGPGGDLKAIGSRTAFTPRRPGLTALVVVGYARRGLADPYEYRVELPDGALLDLLQYEFLMNILERAFPIGVEINTFSIRRRHVDLNGDGAADPLRPAASRTYRPFLRPRQRGEAGVTLE